MSEHRHAVKKRGRPDESEVRREEILDATVRCISKVGLRAATLEAIAKEAGMTRGNVRHFMGNKEALLEALVERIRERDNQNRDRILSETEDADPIEPILEYLYGPEFGSQEQENKVLLDLILAARDDETIQESLSENYEDILRSIKHSVDVDGDDADLAYAMLSMALGAALLSELKITSRRAKALVTHAKALISSSASLSD